VGSGASGGRGGLAARFLLAKTWPQGHFAFLAWTLASQAGQVFWGPRPLMAARVTFWCFGALAEYCSWAGARVACARHQSPVDHGYWLQECCDCAVRFGCVCIQMDLARQTCLSHFG